MSLEEEEFVAPRKRSRPAVTSYLEDNDFDSDFDFDAPPKKKREKKTKETTSKSEKKSNSSQSKVKKSKDVEKQKQGQNAKSSCEEVLDILTVNQSPLESLLKEKKRAKAKNGTQLPKEKSFALASDTETEVAPNCASVDVPSKLDISMKSSSQDSFPDTVIVSESQESLTSLNISANSCDENLHPNEAARRDQWLIDRTRRAARLPSEDSCITTDSEAVSSLVSSGLTFVAGKLQISDAAETTGQATKVAAASDYTDRAPVLCPGTDKRPSLMSDCNHLLNKSRQNSVSSFDQFGSRTIRLGLSRSSRTLTPLHKNIRVSQT